MYQAPCVLRQVPQPGKISLLHFIEGKLRLGGNMSFPRSLSGPNDLLSNPGLGFSHWGLGLLICTPRGWTSNTLLLKTCMPPLPG